MSDMMIRKLRADLEKIDAEVARLYRRVIEIGDLCAANAARAGISADEQERWNAVVIAAQDAASPELSR